MKARRLLSFLFILQIGCCSAQQSDPGQKFPEAGAYKNTKLSYSITQSANSTYGYDIYSDAKRIIHQPAVPGIAGNEGFKTKTGAESVAKLVIQKIGAGIMPPTVTADEMKKLRAIP